MAGRTDKAAALIKDGGHKAKAAASKLYVLAKDPEVQAKAGKLLEDGKKMYGRQQVPQPKRPTARPRTSLERPESARPKLYSWASRASCDGPGDDGPEPDDGSPPLVAASVVLAGPFRHSVFDLARRRVHTLLIDDAAAGEVRFGRLFIRIRTDHPVRDRP